MDGIIFEITIIVCLAAVLSVIFRIFKQPPVIAYIVTGIILGPVGLLHLNNMDELRSLGQIGVALLLFMLGLELKLKELRSIGKTALILGAMQMAGSIAIFYAISMLLGFSPVVSLYLSASMSFASTIIIVKILSDKKDLDSLFGKISLGLLLVQDFFAVIMIIFITKPVGSIGIDIVLNLSLIFLKLFLLIGGVIIFSKYVFPRIVGHISRSQEILFLLSLAWVFAVTALVTLPIFGFSIEIGGFLAGLALANTHESFQIIARMKALRDFFITIFFVILGLELKLEGILGVIFPALIFSLAVMFVKPMIVALSTSILGYKKRTSFLVGITNSQISEFSMILLFMGNKAGIFGSEVVTIGIVVGLATFLFSTYFLQNSKKLYKLIGKKVFIPQRKLLHKDENDREQEDFKDHVVVIGIHHMGQSVIRALSNQNEKIIVIDFDPDKISVNDERQSTIIFGDIADPEIQERAKISEAKLVISTIPDVEDNLLLLQSLKHYKSKARVVVMAKEGVDAKLLYRHGADYVVLPELAGGQHLARILLDEHHLKLIEDYKERDLKFLG